MLPLRTLGPLSFFFFFSSILASQVSPSLGLGRKGRVVPLGRGKFAFTDEFDEDVRMQCTWAARDVADTVRVSVKCEDPGARIRGGVTDIECEYSGKPAVCQGYQADGKTFWRQVARAFKKLQGKACNDERALVRTSLCKSARRDAHFKLDIHTSVASAQSGIQTPPPPPPRPRVTSSPAAPTNCTTSENARRKAEQQCSSTWASLCTFFFQILDDDC